MLDLLKKNNPTQPNNETDNPARTELRHLRKRIALRASLAALTILLTLVIIFGMTAAWYTNVVQSGGLIFRVEQIGVNVDAEIQTASFVAKPGDEGVIGLKATNAGADPVSISVSVNKAAMDGEMQKRLYFYVDSAQTQNAETMERSYVTAGAAYSYTVFGGNSLMLTESYHNAPQLKWCWVYDVLGYYVLGQAVGSDVQVQEYLRPIEYDYDLATFDDDGKLKTVDGSTSVDAFLLSLSESDGYAGYIYGSDMVGDYYRVDVDANGYGVYAYLCTSAEVESHTDYDTKLGIAAMEGNPATYSALLTVNALPCTYETVTVSTADDLATALKSGTAQMIVLAENVILSDPVMLINSDVLLDLNGKTLTTSAADYAFALYDDSALTITNGSLNGSLTSASAGNAFLVQGSDLTLNDVEITGYAKGIQVADYAGDGQDSTVTLTGCTMDTTGHAILLYGNGTVSEQNTKLLIDNCILTSDGYVISGNGTSTGSGRWGTEIEIANSTLTQDVSSGTVAAAIYHPQKDSTMNIYNSTISGYTGIAIKGGSVTITKSTICGTGTTSCEPVLSTSGFSDTADAIYVETGYGYDISLTVCGITASSNCGKGLQIFEENSDCVTFTEEGTNQYLNYIAGNG